MIGDEQIQALLEATRALEAELSEYRDAQQRDLIQLADALQAVIGKLPGEHPVWTFQVETEGGQIRRIGVMSGTGSEIDISGDKTR